MALSIHTNAPALAAQQQLSVASQKSLQNSLTKLSSGLRINSGDDIAISAAAKQLSQMNANTTSLRNSQDVISLVQTAEGGISKIRTVLQRVRELGVQQTNELYIGQNDDRIQQEMTSLLEEIDTIGTTVTFNQQPLLNGSFEQTVKIGNTSEEISIGEMTTTGLNLYQTKTIEKGGKEIEVKSMDFTNEDNANFSLEVIDQALATLSKQSAALGSSQNLAQFHIENLQTVTENMSASRSRITDFDFANETASMTRNQILSQAGTSILAQANSLPSNVLTLLRG